MEHCFVREALAEDGFVGWITFGELREGANKVPRTSGVYVVLRDGSFPVEFLEGSPGGRFKGRDPTVTADALKANWVEGADVVYIGKAEDLRRRLGEYAKFGAGKPIGHWGGRLIWQLSDSAELLVAWKETPSLIPRDVEAQLIAGFRRIYGKPPFANEPHRLGH